MMKAAVRDSYGPPEVFRVAEVPKPVPGDDEILIKVHAATVSAGDCELRAFKMYVLLWVPLRLFMGVFKPRIRILGQEFAGIVESVGKNVTRWKPGDRVFGPTDISMGAYAEYICLPGDHSLSGIPQSMSFSEAATIPVGGLNAIHFLRKATIGAGQKVLVNGAGGSIGTFAIQILKNTGAEVTAVDSHDKLDMLRSIGADRVIDYEKEDFAADGAQYDVVFDVIGKKSLLRGLRSLKRGGTYIAANPWVSVMLRGMLNPFFSSRKVFTGAAEYAPRDFEEVTELITAGTVRAVIDKTYRLDDIVEAHRYVDAAKKKGNVVISVSDA